MSLGTLGVLFGAAILRIAIDAPGRYEVPADAVKGAGLDLAACDLYGGGATETAVPILERKDGGFEFLGAGRARHSKRTAFVLRPRPAGAPATRAGDAAALLAAPPEGYFRVERNEVYDAVTTQDRTGLDPFGYGDGRCDYFYFAKPQAALEVKLAFPAGSGAGAGAGTGTGTLLRLCMQGDRRAGASNGVDLVWNGTRLKGTLRWSGPKAFVGEVEIDPKSLKSEGNTLRLEARDGRVRLAWVELAGPGAGAAAANGGAARRPLAVEKATPEDLTAGGADWLAIAVAGCADALAPLAAHRESQGLKAKVVRLEDVFDGFSAGNFDPRAIRRFLERAAAAWKPAPRYVLLVGDAGYDVDWLRPAGLSLPTALVDTYDNGASGSDNWFVAFAGDRVLPDLAIGRFPVSEPAAVKQLVERTIAHETRSPYGPWRRKLSFVAGVGRFGDVIDRAIEDLALRIFNDYIPQGYELNMTYANAGSPYLYVPSKITDKVIERLNEGAALLNYTGHGGRAGFDDLDWQRKKYPIFESTDVPRVKCGERRPVVFITACWTGCFDYPAEESVGEQLFEHAGGAAAVFASSRVSHPYANAVLSKELVASLFGAEGPKRLGDVVVEAKRLMMTAKDEYRTLIAQNALMFLADPILMARLLQDDAHLYSLLGDPALLMPFPKGKIALEAVGQAIAGKPLTVKGKTDGLADGKAVVTFEIQRKQIRGDLEPLELDKPGYEKRVAKNYEIANEKVVARKEVKVAGGAFEAVLELPDDLLYTKHYVKAYAWNDGGDALGSVEVTVTDEPE